MTLCAAGVSCDRLIMEYTHDEFCDILLPLGACNNWAGTAAWEYALCYPAWCHPDAEVFWQLEHHLREKGSVTLRHSWMRYANSVCGHHSHNWSCGMRVMEKLTWCCARTGHVPVKVLGSTLWQLGKSLVLRTEHTSVSRWLSCIGAMCEWL